MSTKSHSQASQATVLSRIVKKVSRDSEARRLADEKLGGVYRVIHGVLTLPRPLEAFTNPDGSRKEGEPTFEYARMGDEVLLSDIDAAHALDYFVDDNGKLVKGDNAVVEELDAKPSRVGRVFNPPKVTSTNRTTHMVDPRGPDLDRQPVRGSGHGRSVGSVG